MNVDVSLSQNNGPALEDVLHQAVAYQLAGQLQEAENIYRSILQIEPQHPKANHNLGVLYVQLKQPAAGLAFFMVALEADPAHGQYWLSYIDALLQAGQSDAAQQVLALARQSGLRGEDVDILISKLEGGEREDKKNHQLATIDGQNEKIKFNEAEYIAANPDIAVAIQQGRVSSGQAHFEVYGRNEGRLLKRVSQEVVNNSDASRLHAGFRAPQDFKTQKNYCISHEPPLLPQRLYDFVIGLGDYFPERGVNISRIDSFWDENRPISYGSAGSFVVPRVLGMNGDQTELTGLCSRRKIVLRNPAGREADNYPSMRLVTVEGFALLAEDETRPRDGCDFLISRPVHIPEGIIAQYSSAHHIVDLMECLHIAVQFGILTQSDVDELIVQKILIPGGCEFGVFPTKWLSDMIAKLEVMGREFIKLSGNRIRQYDSYQVRAIGFACERIGSFLLLKELKKRYPTGIPNEVFGFMCTVVENESGYEIGRTNDFPPERKSIQTVSHVGLSVAEGAGNIFISNDQNGIVESEKKPNNTLGVRENEIKIFQIYYDEKTRLQADPAFVPLDNTKSSRPDWYEFWAIRKVLLNQSFNDDTYIGFFSPKFFEKTGMTGKQVLEMVRRSSEEVISFSPYFDVNALYLSPFFEGEYFHPGLIKTMQNVLELLQVNLDLSSLVCDQTTTVYSNYFVARYSFWKKWISYAEKIFTVCEGPDCELRTSLVSATMHRESDKYAMKVFIIERLVTILMEELRISSKVGIDIRKAPILASQSGGVLDSLIVCDALKSQFRRTGLLPFIEVYALFVNKLKRPPD